MPVLLYSTVRKHYPGTLE